MSYDNMVKKFRVTVPWSKEEPFIVPEDRLDKFLREVRAGGPTIRVPNWVHRWTDHHGVEHEHLVALATLPDPDAPEIIVEELT